MIFERHHRSDSTLHATQKGLIKQKNRSVLFSRLVSFSIQNIQCSMLKVTCVIISSQMYFIDRSESVYVDNLSGFYWSMAPPLTIHH